MDGTLMDTESLCEETKVQICRSIYGFEMTPEDRSMCYGMTDLEAFDRLFEARGIHSSPEEAVAAMKPCYYALLRERATPLPHTLSFLETVRTLQSPVAIVSGSTREAVHILLSILGAKDLFKIVVTYEDVERSKPHPDPYIKAASLAEVPPLHCLSIEDSPCGIASAVKAGTYCIAVRNNGTCDLRAAHRIVQHVGEIDVHSLIRKNGTTH